MRICILTMADCWGGAEIHTVGLSRTLATRGHEVTIVEIGHNFYERAAHNGTPNFHVIRIDTPRPMRDMSGLEWVRLFRMLKGNVCVQVKGTFGEGSVQFDIAARLSFKRFTTIEHLACPPMPPKSSQRHLWGLLSGMGIWWYRLLLTRYLRSLGPHRVICVSEAVRKRLAQDCGFPWRKMVTVHNGIDPGTFHFSPESRRKTRDTWGIPQGALVFGSVGRFNVQKAYHLALAAFQELVSRYPNRDIRLVLVGEGPLRQELMSIAQDIGLDGRFQLLNFTDRPWEVYSGFDFYLLPSINEGLPFALLEAMACGCCPIATRVGGVPEVLTNSSVGWLVEPNGVSSLLAAMQAAILTPPEARVEMGRRAREHVTTRFNAQVQYSLLADLLE
jgi:glycosyltransferase involved in cell wall biosynthesis